MLVPLNTCVTVKMTLVLHVYIFSENQNKVVDMKMFRSFTLPALLYI